MVVADLRSSHRTSETKVISAIANIRAADQDRLGQDTEENSMAWSADSNGKPPRV